MRELFVKLSLQKDFLKIENKELFLMVVIPLRPRLMLIQFNDLSKPFADDTLVTQIGSFNWGFSKSGNICVAYYWY